MDKTGPPVEIIFSEKEETLSYHEDPLVITLRIRSYDVYQIMIDMESSVDLLFITTIRALGVKDSDIINIELLLVGFNNSTTYANGMVVLLVMAKKVLKMINFVSIDVPAHYIDILGRP